MASEKLRLQVAFYGQLRPIAGGHLFTFDVGRPATLTKLLRTVLEQRPSLRSEIVDARGVPLPYVHLFVNGRDYPFLPNRLRTRLHAHDRVDIFPATAGG